MCLYLDKNNEKLKRTKSDLVCYKVCKRQKWDGKLFTYYQHSEIELEWTYNSKLEKSYSLEHIAFDYAVDLGLHTFTNKKDAVHFINQKKGFFGDNKELVLIKTIISKDSNYYRGVFLFNGREYSSYASNYLKYIEIIKTF